MFNNILEPGLGKAAVLSLNLSTLSTFTTSYFLTLCRTAFFFCLVSPCGETYHCGILLLSTLQGHSAQERWSTFFAVLTFEFPGRGSVWINVMQLPSSGPIYCSQGWSNRWAQHGANSKDKHFQRDGCSEIPTVTYISHCGYDEYIKRRSYLAMGCFFFFFLVTRVFLLVRHF